MAAAPQAAAFTVGPAPLLRGETAGEGPPIVSTASTPR